MSMPTEPVAQDPPSDAPPARKSALFIVFLVVFIDLLGFGIVLPLLPRYAELYLPVVPEAGRGAALGLLYSIFSLMQFVFSPAWGRVSDRIGRRPILLLGLAGSVVFYGLFAAASTLPAEQAWLALGLIFLSRLGAGVAGASVSTAAAVIADCTTKESRAKGMALIGAAFGIGFTFGPLIGYVGLEVFQEQHWAPGVTASLLSLVALVLALRLLPETRTPGSAPAGKEWFSVSRSVEVLKTPTVGALVLVYFLVIFAFANFEGTLSLFTAATFGLADRDNFLIFAYIGAVLMLAQGVIYRRLVGKLSEEALMTAGVGLLVVGLAGVAAVAYLGDADRGLAYPLFFATTALAVTGFAFVNPSVSALVSKRSDPDRQGEVLGVNQSFASLGRILGPFLGLVLFQADPSRTLPYLAAVGLLAVVAVLLPRVRS
ncbi:MAG: MFS transporter [Gemmataceae bacterium]|nr:MFS transporter [Gemmataceae bacterium]